MNMKGRCSRGNSRKRKTEGEGNQREGNVNQTQTWQEADEVMDCKSIMNCYVDETEVREREREKEGKRE